MVFKSGVVVSAPTSPFDHDGTLFQATEAVVGVLDVILLLDVVNVAALSASSPTIVRFVASEPASADVNLISALSIVAP